MFESQHTLHRVPYDGSFRVADTPTQCPEGSEKEFRKRLRKATRKLDAMQRVLMARDRHALLLVFQAMDAAGKDSTIRAVMQGINPAGCQVFRFGRPTELEYDHDFLWRTSIRLPERGRIGIFNRSHYEDVLVVRVHDMVPKPVWSQRYEQINAFEKILADNGTPPSGVQSPYPPPAKVKPDPWEGNIHVPMIVRKNRSRSSPNWPTISVSNASMRCTSGVIWGSVFLMDWISSSTSGWS